MRAERSTRRRAWLALRILVACACVMVGSPAVRAAAERSGERETIARDGVTATFLESGRRLAEHALGIVIEEREDLLERFDGASLAHITVDVADSAEEFARLSYGGVPDWGAGCALHSERRIVVRSPRSARAPHDLRTLLRHELAHLAIYDELGAVRAPRWFHEGVASAVAGEWRLEESAALAIGAWRGTLLPTSELEHSFPSNARLARLAYAESYQAVLLLQELGEVETAPELVRLVAGESSFDAAMWRVTGMDAGSFDGLLLHRLRERFGLALLMRRGNLLFVGAALLVLIGAAVRWRRVRRRLAEWEREEQEGRRGSVGTGGSWR